MRGTYPISDTLGYLLLSHNYTNNQAKKQNHCYTKSYMKVAIQGQAGSFHDMVAKQWYGETTEIIPCLTFNEVFLAYQQKEADAIVTAVENTIYGSINEVYQLIEECNAPIIGEVKQSIDQMLIANKGTKLSDITEVYSHPVALAQCRGWLRENLPNAKLIEFFDTAGAVEFVKHEKRTDIASIASKQAALIYGLPVIHSSIQDSSHNITRFLILEPKPVPAGANRSSLIITTDHRPGALAEVLNIFAEANVNLAKLQSQPIVGQPWNYKFFIVVDTAGDELHKILDEIRANKHQVTVLGEYHSA